MHSVAGCSFAIVQVLDEALGEARRVVLDDLLGEMRVDGIDVLAELGAWRCVDLLNALEAAGLDESLLLLGVLGEHLRKLCGDVLEDVVGGKDEEGLKRRKVSAHLDDVLEGLLRFVLQVGGALALLHHEDGKKTCGDVGLSEVLGVLR